jgi:hypothetical protein
MDVYGRVIWSKDGAGFLSYTEYDQATGGVVKRITDVDTTQTSDFSNLPTGWSTPAGGGLHLKTTYEVDHLRQKPAVAPWSSPHGGVFTTRQVQES